MKTYLLNKQLPNAFQQVEYIQSTGTQYIDTGVNALLSNKIDITIKVPTIENDTNYLGVYYASTSNNYCEFSAFSSRFRFNLQDINTGYANNPLVETNKKFNFIFENRKWYYEGQDYGNTQNTQVLASVYLFARHRADTSGVDKYSKMMLYSCKFYTDNTLVRNFIPCYRKSDNVIGLYDTVNDIFYTNAGTGTFLKGNDVTLYDKKKVSAYLLKRRVPAEYQQVEYLQSNGQQYIDTTYQMNAIHKISYKYKNTNTTGVYGIYALYGRFSNSNSTIQFRIVDAGQYKWGQNYYNYPTDFNIHTIEMSDSYFKKDGTLIAQYTSNALTDTDSLVLFAKRKDDSGTDVIHYGHYAIYYFQIYDNNNTLVRNFIPCYRKSDNKPGLYDTINDVFYTNANTSATQDFTVGNDIDAFIKQKVAVKLLCSEVPSEYQQVKYIQSNGQQYINSGITSSTNIKTIFDFEYVSFNNAFNRVFGTTGVSASQYGCRTLSTGQSQLLAEIPGSSSNSRYTSWTVQANTKYVIKISDAFYVNDTKIGDSYNVPTVIGSQLIWLFAQNANTSGSNIKLYGCQLYNIDTLVRNFVPCYRKADNKPGLYDTVNGVFYTNANASAIQDFTVGSNKWIIK